VAARRASETTSSSAALPIQTITRASGRTAKQQLLCCAEAKKPGKRIPTPSRVTDPHTPRCGRHRTLRASPAGCCGRAWPGRQRTPALLAQVGHAFQPCAVSTFSAMSICCDRVAWLAVPA
jgi:hypothetical protein